MRKFLLVLIMIMAVPIVGKANLIVDYSFESGSGRINTTATGYNQWSQDYAAFVGSEQGITPLDGNQMLRFLSTTPNLDQVNGIGCDVYQYVNLANADGPIASGYDINSANNIAYLSASFNRVNTDDSDFWLYVYFLTNDSFTSGVSTNYIGNLITTDNDPSTWETFSYEIPIMQGTTYVAIRISAIGDMADNRNGINFDGQYLDSLYFDFTPQEVPTAPVPEPSTMLLLGSGMAGIDCLRKRFKKV